MVAFSLDPARTILTALFPAVGERDEAALAQAAAGGDREAFTELVRRCQGRVFGLCYRLVGERDGASDAAQETFARAFAALGSYDPGQRFDVWVLRIARNLCYDQLRRKGFQPALDEEATVAAVDLSPSVEARLEQAQAIRDLESALEKLPPRDREILALYYVQRRTTRDIAEIVGTAPGTIMARLFRARAKLRELLAEAA
ncbi:MAG TPA: RNA polymerase subunit sigma-70 [Myxococcales bacterium]|nr:RNA polymerase subunit sigma-70 [Myxococcales bacterium]